MFKIFASAFVDIFHHFNNSCTDSRTHKGYRLFAIDGSDIDRSRDSNSDSFIVTNQKPNGFNKIHLNALYDLCNKTYFDILLQPTPKEDEHKALQVMLKRNKFFGKNKINSAKTHLCRWDFASPYVLKFRAVRFLLDTGVYETIITSLSREEFSLNEIKELYHLRWGIETSFRELKYAIGLINLHCKKEELIEQEIYASLIMYNYFSRIAMNVTVYKRKNTVYAYKVNFTMAVHVCRKFYREGLLNFKKLIRDIGKYTEPVLPGRNDKRTLRTKGFVGFTYRVAA